MNRIAVAQELVKLAKELVSIEFDTEAEKKKYQQEHEVRPGTKLTVKKDEPVKTPRSNHPFSKARDILDSDYRGHFNKDADETSKKHDKLFRKVFHGISGSDVDSQEGREFAKSYVREMMSGNSPQERAKKHAKFIKNLYESPPKPVVVSAVKKMIDFHKSEIDTLKGIDLSDVDTSNVQSVSKHIDDHRIPRVSVYDLMHRDEVVKEHQKEIDDMKSFLSKHNS